MLRSVRVACFTLLALPAFAFAQVDDTAIAASTCIKPSVPAATVTLDKAAAEKLNAESRAYAGCGDAYMKARRATAEKYQQIANAQVSAANAFAADYNAFAAALGEFSKAQAAKAAQEKK
ncbi:MAG: hypothetical protein Q7J29_08560 [Stagnimonas sp.]|nr:hypothetical protein [Stagnimonas sp.]